MPFQDEEAVYEHEGVEDPGLDTLVLCNAVMTYVVCWHVCLLTCVKNLL